MRRSFDRSFCFVPWKSPAQQSLCGDGTYPFKTEIGLPVGLLDPHQFLSQELPQYATLIKRIRQEDLAAGQSPKTLTDGKAPSPNLAVGSKPHGRRKSAVQGGPKANRDRVSLVSNR